MKKSGYRIRLEWFVPFDPDRIEDIGAVNYHMDQAKEFSHLTLLRNGGEMVNITTKWHARREVPDAPKPVEAQAVMQEGWGEPVGNKGEMPPIPDNLRRP